MNRQLTAIICSLFPFLCVAEIAKGLQIIGVICSTEAHGNNMIQRQRAFFATSRTPSIWRIAAQDSLPLLRRTNAVGVLLAGALAGFCYAIGFRVALAIGADNGIASFFVFTYPIGRALIQMFAVVLAVLALLFTDSIRVFLAISSITFAFFIGVSLDVISLIGSAALMALGLFTIGRTVVRRELVNRFSLFALGASLEDNRHYSISLLDWIVPRLYQQRVVFSYLDFTTFSHTVQNGIGGQS